MRKINVFHRVNYKDLNMIIDNMFNLYKSGIPIFNSFELLEELPLTKEYKESISTIKEELKSGEGLSYAFSCHEGLYPKFFLSMLQVGEETGRLCDVLNGLDIYYKKVNLMQQKIKNSLTYPGILIAATLVLAIFFSIVVIPTFQDVFVAMEKESPKILKLAILLKNFINKSPLLAIIYFTCWIIIIPVILFSYNKEKLTNEIYKIPLIKRFEEYVSVVLLSIIIKSGVSLSRGLEYCMDIDILGGVKEQFNIINLAVMEGKSLTLAMENTSIFTKYTLAHIKLGEECGNLDSVLNSLEKELFDRLNLDVNRSLELISPVIIVFIGVVILTFILIVILPIFEGLIG